MFSFFRKSKKGSDNSKESKDKRNKDSKESTPTRGDEGAGSVAGSKDSCKNNIQTTTQKAEIAPESDARQLPNYSSDFGTRKNATNAPSPSDTLNEKIDTNSPSANPDIIATMCDKNASPVDAIPQAVAHANVLRQLEPVIMTERRGSSVKPCGHGTVAIAPYVPIIGSKRDNAGTPPASPVSEVKKPFKIVQNGIDERAGAVEATKKLEGIKEGRDDQNTVTASMKLHVNLPVASSARGGKENGVEKEVEMYVSVGMI